MKSKNLISFAGDFVSYLIQNIGPEDFEKIILFGSVARKEASRKSDIDIFIESKKNIQDKVNKEIGNFYKSSKYTKYWRPLDVKNQIKCVVLNCCYSAIPAKEIVQKVDCVIGINSDLEDESAVAFAAAFYLALAENEDLQIAFDFAVNEFLRDGSFENKPELFIKSGINPSETYFIEEKGIITINNTEKNGLPRQFIAI